MANVQLNILTSYKATNSLGFHYPLLINRPRLKEKGVKIDFYARLNKRIYDCDVIFINSKFFREWHTDKQKLYDKLADLKKKIPKVIWFDTTDSTGTTQFNVMPFVDGYYKNQVLKDRTLYFKHFNGHRIFVDYYKNTFGLHEGDEINITEAFGEKSVSVLLQKEHAHKLYVSWNSAMNEWGNYEEGIPGYMRAWMRTLLPFKTYYTARFVSSDKSRDIDILGRMGLSYASDTLRCQRELVAKILREKFSVDSSKIPRKQYLEEIKNSKIGVSPFGLGEISCRDFEIIIGGALLFKQDMSHMETWPQLYIEDRTYVPFSWDFSDFEEKLRGLLCDRERRIEISKNAQEVYSYCLGEEGQSEFRNKILNIVR